MKQSEHFNPSEETGTGCSVTTQYGRTPPNKHGCVGRQQQQQRIRWNTDGLVMPLTLIINQTSTCGISLVKLKLLTLVLFFKVMKINANYRPISFIAQNYSIYS